ncbi:Glycosyl hydrolases family 2, TIM barrel domain [Saccharopolyspora antimicrobica]|uniref:Glycosyl hydrolase family 2 n=1 Tax=Saccharopolyspora antimicrobica TaxID=455193 RepID=A0A1I4SFM4_9PSEU|nr:sugar-binding domain-containing protein [Saccharopolyspora antimicrobica]RKT87721.1 glycosyl hydrolase family 2 [Saccharopolyspora antimicrobica]SFM63174.1 Glycosyl hydrolases family 2, TIM barrel domain [Saccharopolyspora antimicrobica]
MLLRALLLTALFAASSGLPVAAAEPWRPKPPPLTTPWTEEVGPDNALPEYPRPQLTRERWLNLNGLWAYGGGSTPPEQTGEQILVPYPPESGLSGVQRHDDHMLYRRTFQLPPDWSGQRVLLHFGAVDQKAEVSVNDRPVAVHEGGYTSFSADITDALVPGDEQEVEVAVSDRNDADPYPVGKQRNQPGGILYTGASGIWQTVWLEPVPQEHVAELDITPDLTGFDLTAHTSARGGQQVEAVVVDRDGREVSRATGQAGTALRLPVAEPHLWTPDDPYLYDIRVRLAGSGDEVGSYAGLRTVELRTDEQGRPRLALNGEILFQHGPLDQGYWPDGIYTAPTDEALRYDLEVTKRLGFNMVRKHVKVEPARWYYWTDRLGLLVWQDMPSLPIDLADPPGSNPPPGEQARANFRAELTAMIDQLRSVTSIVAWVPFNEGWGEFETAEIAELTRRSDPTRLIDISSGVNCCYSLPDSGAGDIYDDHTYVGPGRPEVRDGRAVVDGEYGGLGLIEEGHLWPGQPGAYEMTDSREALTRRYGEVSDELVRIIEANGLAAAIYTQTTDVENEVNGFLTYDRRILKPDLAAVRANNLAAIDAGTP